MKTSSILICLFSLLLPLSLFAEETKLQSKVDELMAVTDTALEGEAFHEVFDALPYGLRGVENTFKMLANRLIDETLKEQDADPKKIERILKVVVLQIRKNNKWIWKKELAKTFGPHAILGGSTAVYMLAHLPPTALPIYAALSYYVIMHNVIFPGKKLGSTYEQSNRLVKKFLDHVTDAYELRGMRAPHFTLFKEANTYASGGKVQRVLEGQWHHRKSKYDSSEIYEFRSPDFYNVKGVDFVYDPFGDACREILDPEPPKKK